ncbi:hypothetical protein [Lagierella sp.]|uniref:hypothetical protein n=1 Tax=Lagierella sp. TaxID=2849657 RepID=UPI0026337129|nr:hypothetical protein [Lagierella sp.]
MKKTAVLIYDSFCNFEISVALEILAPHNRDIVVIAKSKEAILSEDALRVLPDKTIFELDINEYNSFLLPGASDIKSAIEDPEINRFMIFGDNYKALRITKRVFENIF